MNIQISQLTIELLRLRKKRCDFHAGALKNASVDVIQWSEKQIENIDKVLYDSLLADAMDSEVYL